VARQNPPMTHTSCGSRRLAEGGVASVDVSNCGMISVHLGAFTLRLTRDALAQLSHTLNVAVQRDRQGRGAENEAPGSAGSFMRPARGNA
jgi:hypothetical protein